MFRMPPQRPLARHALPLLLITATTTLALAGARPALAQTTTPPSVPTSPSEPLSASPSTGESLTTPVADTGTTGQRRDVLYGVAGRGRWVSVPSWLLNLFTKKNVPLSAWGVGAEFFRRKGDLDIAVGITYQKMGPPDGNWLGKGKDARIDTDFIQFKNFGMVGFDVAFVRNEPLNEYLALRFGAGLGLGIITGEMWRISAANCTESNAGNTDQCYPVDSGGRRVTPDRLPSTRGATDNGPQDAHQFKEDSVPGAVPILNVNLGLTVHFPQLKGFELRPLEVGFYNAFFVGGSAGYLF